MRLKITFYFFLLNFFLVNGQEPIIYATTNKNTNIFFKSPIKSGIVGNNKFTFGYDKKNSSKIAILKAFPGNESNLLVVTENGNIYSFIIRYSKDITKLNYFINDSLAIGNENGSIIKSEKIIVSKKTEKKETELKNLSNDENVTNNLTVNDYRSDLKYAKDTLKNGEKVYNLYEEDKIAYFKKISKGEIDKNRFFRRFYAAVDNVYLQLKNIVYNKNELYFTLIIHNKSSLDYDVNYLNFYLNSRNKSRNTTTQTLPYKPVFEYNVPKRIEAGEKIEVVFVYDKFSINQNKALQVELNEANGERNVLLEILNNYINNPN